MQIAWVHVRVGSVPEDTDVGFAEKFWGSLPTINDKGL